MSVGYLHLIQGTKGDNNASALGGVTASKGKDGQQTVEVEFPTDQNDINRNYEKFIKVLSEPRPDEKAHRDAQTKKEDFFKQFRTRVVLTWMLCNALMIIVMTNNAITDSLSAIFKISSTNNAQEKSNPYLTVHYINPVYLFLSTCSFSHKIYRLDIVFDSSGTGTLVGINKCDIFSPCFVGACFRQTH
jgi:hypothetical protein